MNSAYKLVQKVDKEMIDNDPIKFTEENVSSHKKPEESVSSSVPSFQILKRPNLPTVLPRDDNAVDDINSRAKESMDKSEPINVNTMHNSITLVNGDETFTNADRIFTKYLLNNKTFTTVSVIGRQDVGRSTIANYLAGATYNEIQNCKSFFKQYKHTSSQPTHSSSAVSAQISDNRCIVLDSSPLLSSSNAFEIKHHSHFHLHGLLQNLRQLSYLMCISHVIIVVMESSLDLDLFRLILEAEKLKPNPNKKNNSQYYNYYPDLVFVLNKANHSDLELIEINKMKKVISDCFAKSNLQVKNLLMMPNMSKFPKEKGFYKAFKSNDQDNFIKRIYKDFGMNEYESPEINIMNYSDNLVDYVYSLPHRHFIHNETFSEQDWFAYAKRCFLLVKKSPAFSEYHNFILNNAY